MNKQLVLISVFLIGMIGIVFGATYTSDCRNINCDQIGMNLNNNDNWIIQISDACKITTTATSSGLVNYTILHPQIFSTTPSDKYNGAIVPLTVMESYQILPTNGNFLKYLTCDKNLLNLSNSYYGTIGWSVSSGGDWNNTYSTSYQLFMGSPIIDFALTSYQPLATISTIYNISISYLPPNLVFNISNVNSPMIVYNQNQTFGFNISNNIYSNPVYNAFFNESYIGITNINISDNSILGIQVNNTNINDNFININITDTSTSVNYFNTNYTISLFTNITTTVLNTFNNAFDNMFNFTFVWTDDSTNIKYENINVSLYLQQIDNSTRIDYHYNNVTANILNNYYINNNVTIPFSLLSQVNNSIDLIVNTNGSLVCGNVNLTNIVEPATCAPPTISMPEDKADNINVYVNGSTGNQGVVETPRTPLTKDETYTILGLGAIIALVLLILGWRYTRNDKPSNGYSFFKKKPKDETPIPNSLYDKMNREIEIAPKPIKSPERVKG